MRHVSGAHNQRDRSIKINGRKSTLPQHYESVARQTISASQQWQKILASCSRLQHQPTAQLIMFHLHPLFHCASEAESLVWHIFIQMCIFMLTANRNGQKHNYTRNIHLFENFRNVVVLVTSNKSN